MKKHLITGLIILLPLALTIFVVAFIFNLLTDPFVGAFKSILNNLGLIQSDFLFFTADEIQRAVSKLMILIFLFIFTLVLGFLARWFLIRYLLKIWDFTIHRIPFVSNIYRLSQDVINTLFSSRSNSFKQVVMVPFPNPGSYSIGLITRDDLPALQTQNGQPLVAVFIPTAPNPTSGFLIAFEEKDLVYLDMRVEEAFKCIVSCGVLLPPFRAVSKEEAIELFKQREVQQMQKQT